MSAWAVSRPGDDALTDAEIHAERLGEARLDAYIAEAEAADTGYSHHRGRAIVARNFAADLERRGPEVPRRAVSRGWECLACGAYVWLFPGEVPPHCCDGGES